MEKPFNPNSGEQRLGDVAGYLTITAMHIQACKPKSASLTFWPSHSLSYSESQSTLRTCAARSMYENAIAKHASEHLAYLLMRFR